MTAHPAPVLISDEREPNLLIRIAWFVLIGWWLSGIVAVIATLIGYTIIGLPLTFYLANRIPFVTTLKHSKKVLAADGTVTKREQLPFIIRAIWFLAVGWWATALLVLVAWACAITVVGLPATFALYGAYGKVLTLKR